MTYSTSEKLPPYERIDMANRRIAKLKMGAGNYKGGQRIDEIVRARSVIEIAQTEIRRGK
jgi:hypothetical protein